MSQYVAEAHPEHVQSSTSTSKCQNYKHEPHTMHPETLCTCMLVQLYTCMSGLEVKLWCLFSSSPLVGEIGSLTGTQDLPNRLGWLASKRQESTLGLYVYHHIHLTMWTLGFELQSSSLFGKHLIDYAITLAPALFCFWGRVSHTLGWPWTPGFPGYTLKMIAGITGMVHI